MIDFTEIRRILEKFLQDNFTLCPVKEENTPLDTTDLKNWIAVFDRTDFSESTGMGETAYHLGGQITIRIYSRLNTGTADARFIAQELTNLFNSTEISGIVMQTPELYPGAENKHWYEHQLIIKYTTITGQDPQC